MSANIEIERKFVLSPQLAERLMTALESKGSSFEKRSFQKTRFTDIYYELTDTWTLTLRDWWLRRRETQWQLKVPWGDRSCASELDTYRELETLTELEAVLGWSPDAALHHGHIEPFAQIVTERDTFLVTYQGQTLRIDLDRADFGYAIGEIEALVQENGNEHEPTKASLPTAEAVSLAENAIFSFAREMGIAAPRKTVHGKLAEYIRRFRPAHYAALVRHRIFNAEDATSSNQLNADRNQ